MTYAEKLKDPRWQKKRLEILERDKWTCFCCGRKTETLHVHHLLYITGKDPWDYESNFLITYCEICHETEHLIGKQLDEILIELIKNNPIFITGVSKMCVLIEKYPPFQEQLKQFLNTQMMNYLHGLK